MPTNSGPLGIGCSDWNHHYQPSCFIVPAAGATAVQSPTVVSVEFPVSFLFHFGRMGGLRADLYLQFIRCRKEHKNWKPHKGWWPSGPISPSIPNIMLPVLKSGTANQRSWSEGPGHPFRSADAQAVLPGLIADKGSISKFLDNTAILCGQDAKSRPASQPSSG